MSSSANGSPRDYGVPHDTWRPAQLSAFHKAREALSSGKPVVLLELGTGTGKSTIASALAHDERVVVYVHSLGLLDQYRDKYGFAVIKGKDNYPCINQEVIDAFRQRAKREPTASDCPYDQMDHCSLYGQCPYFIARENALGARRMACTYPFALLSPRVKQRKGIAVWDEAHISADTIVSLSSITITSSMRKDFGLPSIPLYGFKDAITPRSRDILLSWLDESLQVMGNTPNAILPDELARWRRVKQKLEFALEELSDTREYFLESWKDEYFTKSGRRKKGGEYLMLKPFTASRFSSRLLEGKRMTILMSATIGNPVPLTQELGITHYDAYDYPHPVPADKRPIYNLDFERMTWGNLRKYDALPMLQARRIAEFVETMPRDWRGIVLTSSYAKLKNLRSHLINHLGDRIFIPPEDRPAKRIEAFIKDNRQGIISVDLIQSWGTGLDLYGDLGRFVVVAGLPFKVQTDPFEKARSSRHGKKYYWWQAYMSVPQACGRVSRGEVEENGEYSLNVAALADGSATTGRALKHYPKYFKEAIEKFP